MTSPTDWWVPRALLGASSVVETDVDMTGLGAAARSAAICGGTLPLYAQSSHQIYSNVPPGRRGLAMLSSRVKQVLIAAAFLELKPRSHHRSHDAPAGPQKGSENTASR